MHAVSALPSVGNYSIQSAVFMALLYCFSPRGAHTTQGLIWELSGGLHCSSVLQAFALLHWVYSVHIAQGEPRTNIGSYTDLNNPLS